MGNRREGWGVASLPAFPACKFVISVLHTKPNGPQRGIRLLWHEDTHLVCRGPDGPIVGVRP